MANGLNRVMLLGNLGADPELKMTSSGQALLKMRLATSESYLDRNKVRQERTEWHTVVLWGKRAEALAKFLSKGANVFIEGALRTSSYDDREGNKRYKTEVVAHNLILTGKKPSSGGRQESAPDRDDADDGYDSGGSAPADDDDIPF